MANSKSLSIGKNTSEDVVYTYKEGFTVILWNFFILIVEFPKY